MASQAERSSDGTDKDPGSDGLRADRRLERMGDKHMRPRLLSKALRKLAVCGLLALGLSLAASRASAQSTLNSVFFAHFAWGGQINGFWTTSDNYTNGTTANLSAMLQLFAPDGTQNLPACEVDFTNGTTLHLNPCNNIPVALPANQFSSLGLKIKGEPGVSLQTGWSRITFTAPVISSRQFAFTSDGSNLPRNDPYTEVAVLPSTPLQFFGASVTLNSGIALANPLFGVAGGITIQGSVFDTSGNLVTQNSFSLGPNQQTSKLLGGPGGFFPALPPAFQAGYVLFKSDQTFLATGFNFEANSEGVDLPAATGPNFATRYDGTESTGGTFSILISPEGKGRFSCLLTTTPSGSGRPTTVACAGSTNVNHNGDVTFQFVQTDPNAQGGASFAGGFSTNRTTIQGVIMNGPDQGFSSQGTFTGSAVGPITW